jgi:hypothetical protein
LSDSNLAFFSGWASIVSLGVSLISLALVRSIRANIIRFRRKQRVRQLLDDVGRIPEDAIPLSPTSRSKLVALKRNIPAGFFARFSERGRAARELHKHIDQEDLVAVKEAIDDWRSYSEDP